MKKSKMRLFVCVRSKVKKTSVRKGPKVKKNMGLENINYGKNLYLTCDIRKRIFTDFFDTAKAHLKPENEALC